MRTSKPGSLLSVVTVLTFLAFSFQACADEQARPGFVSACETDLNDSNFSPGTVLAFVHIIGQDQSVLFSVSRGELEPRAWWHHKVDGEEFLEAQGGVESTLTARDIVDFLRRKPFSLVEDWKSTLRGGRDFERCAIKYEESERYRKRP